MTQRLSADDWLNAAFRMMIADGIESVRVERLAVALNLTKGSFYWHFKDRPALLAAMLAAWQARATGAIIDAVEAEGGSPAERLAKLISLVFRSDGRLDRAIRAWAATDTAAASAQAAIDSRRLDYVTALLSAAGLSDETARARARFTYQALIGQFQIGSPLSPDERVAETLAQILPVLLLRADQ